jgi:hypothetical protein
MIKLEKNEVQRILEMHLNYKKKVILEQNSPESTTNTNDTKVNDELNMIFKARDAKCFPKGEAKYLKGTKKPVWVVKGEKTGKVVIFYPDMTYEFADKSKKGKWKCDAITKMDTQKSEEKTKTTDLTRAQTEIKKKWTDFGYKDELTPEETSSGLYQKFIVPNTEKYFPPNGLELWGSQKGLTTKANTEDGENTSTNLETVLNNSRSILKSQKPKASLCKEVIRTYYESYSTNSDLPQPEFTTMKRGVERCVAFYSKKGWGLFSPNIPKYIKELQGSTTKWRINI